MRIGEKPVAFKATKDVKGQVELAATTTLTIDEVAYRQAELRAAVENYDQKLAYFQRQRQMALDELASLETAAGKRQISPTPGPT